MKSRRANATRRPRYKIAPARAAILYLRRKKIIYTFSQPDENILSSLEFP